MGETGTCYTGTLCTSSLRVRQSGTIRRQQNPKTWRTPKRLLHEKKKKIPKENRVRRMCIVHFHCQGYLLRTNMPWQPHRYKGCNVLPLLLLLHFYSPFKLGLRRRIVKGYTARSPSRRGSKIVFDYYFLSKYSFLGI